MAETLELVVKAIVIVAGLYALFERVYQSKKNTIEVADLKSETKALRETVSTLRLTVETLNGAVKSLQGQFELYLKLTKIK